MKTLKKLPSEGKNYKNENKEKKKNDYLQNNEKRDAIVASFERQKLPSQEEDSKLEANPHSKQTLSTKFDTNAYMTGQEL